ncbi:MAG: uracil-DNA glycosylase [Patescibacteria group bacterium]|nr:uracil-DNA glycosylase [Patescibacteria group bacterium]
MPDVRIDQSWKHSLAGEFNSPYFAQLAEKVRAEYLSKQVYPPARDVFRAFDLCPFDAVKVVIIGQDPYHGAGQANGLCFAVHEGVRIPPSLKNIFKEIQDDLGVAPLPSGDLSRWAKQGVLLLNAVLTVRAGSPASHRGLGWERFTDAVVRALNDQKQHLVYLLWGKFAQEKGAVVDPVRNLVLTSAHPSPYSADRFFGNHHFSRCNAYLVEHGLDPIDWR